MALVSIHLHYNFISFNLYNYGKHKLNLFIQGSILEYQTACEINIFAVIGVIGSQFEYN